MTIDWSRPIEAVHEDGRVKPAEARGSLADRHLGRFYAAVECEFHWPFNAEGVPIETEGSAMKGWRIRNGATPAPKYPDPLVERMVGLVRRLAAKQMPRNVAEDEAYAIAAELPAEVDADEAYARALLKEQGWHKEPVIGSEAVAVMLAKAHREGRAATQEE